MTGAKWAPSAALAAPIPTPTAGSASVLAAPVPNPVQFNFAPNTLVSSSQVNSNNYGLWVQIGSLVTTLNGCSWVPGGAISSVTFTAPITGTLQTCTAGAGTGANLTIALTHGDYADLSTTQTIAGSKIFTAPPNFMVSSSAYQIKLSDTAGSLPNKYLRVNGTTGDLEIVNSAFTAVNATIGDNGQFRGASFQAAGVYVPPLTNAAGGNLGASTIGMIVPRSGTTSASLAGFSQAVVENLTLGHSFSGSTNAVTCTNKIAGSGNPGGSTAAWIYSATLGTNSLNVFAYNANAAATPSGLPYAYDCHVFGA